ncbi:UNVERIFIED_CONTAM: hypothetical protein K2H54_059497 [Gekko kuhli]
MLVVVLGVCGIPEHFRLHETSLRRVDISGYYERQNDPAGIFELVELVGNGTYGQVYKNSQEDLWDCSLHYVL